MLTIACVPKAFTAPSISIIQDNAIMSWLHLHPQPELILFGNGEGVRERSVQWGVRHVPDIAQNEFQTPLLHDIFAKAQQLATFDLLAYVNADIILTQDFMESVTEAANRFRRFLLIGRRRDLRLETRLAFDDPAWADRLRREVLTTGKLGGVMAMDYFVFSRGLYDELPPFAIGRSSWDNWLVWKATTLRVPIIDATKTVVAVHQEHDYLHVAGSRGTFIGPEAERNRALAAGRSCTCFDATYLTTPAGMTRAWPVLRNGWRWLSDLLRYQLGRLRHRLGFRRSTLTRVLGWARRSL